MYAGVRLSDNKMVAIKHVPRSTVRLWCSSSGYSVPREICLLRRVSGSSNVVRLLDFYERHDRLGSRNLYLHLSTFVVLVDIQN